MKGRSALSRRAQIIAAALALIIVAASLGWAYLSIQQTIEQQDAEISRLTNDLHNLELQVSDLTAIIQSNSPDLSFSLAQLYSKVKDSVVVVQGIQVTRINTIFGVVLQYAEIQGSGFVCNETGRTVIVTNYHVVDQVQNLTISLSNGDAFDATVLGTDAYSDLAILQTSAPASELHPLVLASSSGLQVGDPVVAVGSPLGLEGSMTSGIVSQLGRTIQESTTGGYSIANVIQTNVAINAGNSGGPLLNSLGQVVGVTTAIISGTQGIGLAIPSDTIIRELPDLVSVGTYDKHSWIGVAGVDVTPDIANALGLNKTYGYLVTSVTAGGPADNAGIRGGTSQARVLGTTMPVGGDIIIALNEVRIRNGDDLSAYLEAWTLPGQTVQVTILRGNVQHTVSVVLGKRPALTS